MALDTSTLESGSLIVVSNYGNERNGECSGAECEGKTLGVEEGDSV